MESSDRLVTGSSGAASGARSPDDDSATAAVIHSPGAIDARAGGASVIQVETLGRHGIIVLWISALIGAAALVTSLAFAFWIDRVSARVYVLEYDAGRICAQLLEAEVVEACH